MEDIADMFSGYVYGFAQGDDYDANDRAAGKARYNWMDSQMLTWINLAITNNDNR